MAGNYYNGYMKSRPRKAIQPKFRVTYSWVSIGRPRTGERNFQTQAEVDEFRATLDAANVEAEQDPQGGHSYKVETVERWVRGRGWSKAT